MKLNHPNRLPPVLCPQLIELEGRLQLAERTGHIETRDRAMEYRLLERIDGQLIPTGETIVGRHHWTYP